MSLFLKLEIAYNLGVAFAKGASETNEFFENINKQLYMTNKPGRTRQRTKNLRVELIWR